MRNEKQEEGRRGLTVGMGCLWLAVFLFAMGFRGIPLADANLTDLFISRYIEGSSLNKAVEIYNGTGAAIDLDAGNYVVAYYFNGSTTAGFQESLTGTVSAGDVFVLSNPDAALTNILNESDQASGSNSWYNGDDAVVLWKGGVDGTVLDSLGQVGVDPGSEWNNGGVGTQNQTLTRISSVCVGDTNTTDAFDPSAEWTAAAQDDTAGLGSHSVSCGSADTPPTVTSTDPVNDATDVAANADLTVTFSEAVTPTDNWAQVVCDVGGTQSVGGGNLAVTGGPQSYTLNPDADFTPGDSCTLTVFAAQVVDQDGTPDPMAADTTAVFSILDAGQITRIHEVQGSGTATPLDGQTVTVEGIVTAAFQGYDGALAGFFVQEEDADIDADPLTSEGIFVFDGTAVTPGDRVQVTGTAGEFFGNTQISGANVTIVDTGNALPAAAEVALPLSDADALEPYEGMIVNFPQTLTVTNIFTLARFGEIELSSGGRLFQPTQVADPGATANALQAENDMNRIILDDGRTSQNPVPAPFGLSAANTIRGGATITGLTGPLNFSFGEYRIQKLHTETAFLAESNPRPANPPAVGGSLKVASFNVLNYFSTIDDSGAICGPGNNQGCRGADSDTEFTRQRDKIIAAIAEIDADVVGLMELENTAATSGIQDLVNGLNTAMGAGAYDFVNTGTIGDDAIRVGLIYKPATVNLFGSPAILDDSVDSSFNDDFNRPSLAQTFEEIATGERFTVAVNHFKSKGSACDALGDPDTGDGQGNCNLTRTGAATALANWLNADPTGSGDPDFLIIGDINAYAKEDPLAALEAAGYVNETAGGYSFSFDGQWGSLDHALANPSLHGQVAGTGKWHVNADEPIALDYNLEFKSTGQQDSFYAPDAYRSSDHDPLSIGLNLGCGCGDVAGDVNGDDGTDLADAILILRVLTGATPAISPCDCLLRNGDVDGNGSVGIPDAVFILQTVLNLRS